MAARPVRLTAVDASFLVQEVDCAVMTVGGIATFDGPAPSIDEFRAHTLDRLHRIPRYRQRLRNIPGGAARAVWVDDERFEVSYHVRHAGLPGDGSLRELWSLYADVHAHRLDPTRPLWEIYLVDGLVEGQFAVIARNHHALMDGVSNMDVLAALWDLEPSPPAASDQPSEFWRAAPEPSDRNLVLQAAREASGAALAAGGRLAGAVRNPGATLARVRRGAEGAAEIGRAVMAPAPATPFNQKIGPGRRFTAVRLDLAEIKRVKNVLGGTVNDVMLDVVAGGIRGLYTARGLDPSGVDLRPIVPVSIRAESERGALGNRVVTLRPALPIGIEDPVERLQAISQELERCKRSTQPTVVEVLASVSDWMPAPALGPVARLGYHPRLFNVLISNIPGPQFPLYLLGRKAKTMYAGGFLTQRQALAFAAVSYDGGLGFGLMSDPSVVPELDVVAAGLEDCFDDLRAAASAASAAGAGAVGGGGASIGAGSQAANEVTDP
ncbi:MAG: wax ester/triacylglycerol synthase family O-acyltransferase [Solirubrobacteraceae bacterium]